MILALFLTAMTLLIVMAIFLLSVESMTFEKMDTTEIQPIEDE